MLECAALFISDLHLGSNQCEARELSAFLKLVRPQQLYLVGDVIDLQAIRFNSGVSESFLHDQLKGCLELPLEQLLERGPAAGRKYLRHTHRQVLRDLVELSCQGVRLIYIPGNHDAYFRRHAGLERGSFAIRREDVYVTPSGQRLLVRHGDEFDQVIQLHSAVAGGLTRVQEGYAQVIRMFRAAAEVVQPGEPPGGWIPEDIIQGAVDLLARHWEWPVPEPGAGSSSGFSLAFALERVIKTRTGHDRLLKRLMSEHLFRENRAQRGLDGIVNGHTHIPEATAFETPAAGAGELRGPCHVTTYNDGSWARSQRHLGRTALMVASDGTIGMIRFDRRRGIVPFQPPRFPFNTYPMRPCSGCGTPVAILDA